MHLPGYGGHIYEIDFRLRSFQAGELYFDTGRELDRVLVQDNPVFLSLELPGMLSRVLVCFPVFGFTRVYMKHIHPDNLIGEHDAHASYGREVRSVPRHVRYRYGMYLTPWMFDGWVNGEARQSLQRDVDAHYTVLNQNFGHCGVVIRVARREERAQERLEIYSINTGNDFEFAAKWRDHEDTRLLACFVPVNPESPRLSWRPENGAPELRV